MTYRELFYKATRLINNDKITLGEYEEMTKPLDREIEQEPIKPMVEIDLYSVIKQKYIEREVLDKIITEVEIWRKDDTNWSDIRLMNIEDIIDKYKAETEAEDGNDD